MSDRDITIVVRGKNLSASDVLAASKDVSSFTKAIADSKETSKAFIDTLRGFSGLDVGAKAQDYAKAVDAIGGASKLTASEQAKVNAVVTEAIAKYKALGQTAPAEMEQLAAATKQVPESLSLAARGAEGLKGSLLQMTAAFGLTHLITSAVGSIVTLGHEAITSAGHLIDLRDKTGLTTDTLQEMQAVAVETGSTIDDFTNAAFKLGLKLAGGSGSVQKAIKDLGLSFQELQRTSPDEQYNQVIDSLGKMENAQERNRIAVELFDKSAKGIMAGVAGGYREIADAAGKASGAQIKAIDDANDAWERFYNRQKTRLTSMLGEEVLRQQQTASLTAEQQAEYAQILRNPLRMDQQAEIFLRQALAKNKGDVNLPIESAAKPPVSPDYVAALQAAEAEIDKLTASQRAQIEAAKKMGAQDDELTARFGISTAAMHLYDEVINKANATAEKHIKALQAIYDAEVPLTEVQQLQIRVYMNMGASAELAAEAIGVSGIAAKKYAKDLEEAGKASTEFIKITDQMAAVSEKAAAKVLNDHRTLAEGILKASGEALVAQQAEARAINQTMLDESNKATMGEFEVKQLQVLQWVDKEKAALDRRSIYYDENLANINAIAKGRFDALDRSHDEMLAKMKASENSWANAFKSVLADLPSFLQDAFSGNGLGQALDGLTKKIGASLGGKALTDLFNKGATGLAGVLGMGFTEALGVAIPGIGQAIGSLLGPAVGAIGHLFGIGETQGHKDLMAGNQQIADMKAQLLQTYGTMSDLQLVGKAFGVDWQAAWSSQNLAGAQHFKELLDQMTKGQGDFNNKLGSTLTAIGNLGGSIPESLAPYLETLRDAKGLTQDNVDLIAKLTGDGTVGYQQMEAAAQALGISTDALGQAYHDAKANADWQSVIDNVDILVRGHADLNALIDGASDKIDDLVIQSLKFGTVIPANAKPWVQQLIDEGKLLDENGNKITDMAAMHFGDSPLETTLQSLDQDLKDLVDTMRLQFPQAARTAVDGMNDAFQNVRLPKLSAWDPGGDAGGAIPMASGGDFLVTRPTLFLAGEKGPERAYFSGAGNLSRSSVSQAGGGDVHVSIGGITVNVPPGTDVDERKLAAAIVDQFRKDGTLRSRARRVLGVG